jgi:hypothetical protein
MTTDSYELPPFHMLNAKGQDLAWHALNYRTAHTAHAQFMWLELERYVREYALLAVQRERERCIAACRKVRQDLDEYAERNNYHGDAWEYIDKCEAAIRKG